MCGIARYWSFPAPRSIVVNGNLNPMVLRQESWMCPGNGQNSGHLVYTEDLMMILRRQYRDPYNVINQ